MATTRTIHRKTTRAPVQCVARWPIQKPLVVCSGGPLDARWYFADDFTIQQSAAVRLGDTADRPAGAALAYHPCTPYRGTGHPQFDLVGQVLTYDPTYPATPGDHQPTDAPLRAA
ncbi:hypothetical protein [Fodinicola feengrottensis]|uniref:hypothetical protein n=1 Tax=Fodinicola feengrottensis TaxID=435914 RepID=UPI0013D1B4B0|nr:hypothetical protein [Fodinicola feengrottensis]